MEWFVVAYIVAVGNVGRIKTRWILTIAVIYLVAVTGACFLYVPFDIAGGIGESYNVVYKWLWNNSLEYPHYDLECVGLELAVLTAIAGILLLVGLLLTRGRKRERITGT